MDVSLFIVVQRFTKLLRDLGFSYVVFPDGKPASTSPDDAI